MTFQTHLKGLSASTLGLLLLFGLNACGLENPYKKREPRCKLNCEKGNDEATGQETEENGSGFYLRPGLEIPLDASYWLNNTPISALDQEEVLLMAVSNPLITVQPTDPSYGQGLPSIETVLQTLQRRVELARESASDQGQVNQEARSCFQQAFSQQPERTTRTGAVSYLAKPGLCFSLDSVQQILSEGSPALQQAHIYEDTLAIQLRSADSAEGMGLTDLLTGTQAFFGLPLIADQSERTTLNDLSIQSLQMQGLQYSGRNSDVYELVWDYLNLGLGQTGQSFQFAWNAEDSAWTLNGVFLQLTGYTQDSRGLSLQDAMTGEGMGRIVVFNDFTVEGSQDLSQALLRTSEPRFGGSYQVDVLLPSAGSRAGTNVDTFEFHGTGEPCMVDVKKPQLTDESLGKIDICKQHGAED